MERFFRMCKFGMLEDEWRQESGDLGANIIHREKRLWAFTKDCQKDWIERVCS